MSATLQKQLDRQDKAIKQKLRNVKMHGMQASDERLYMAIEHGERGVKSVEYAHVNTKIKVPCYMTYQAA